MIKFEKMTWHEAREHLKREFAYNTSAFYDILAYYHSFKDDVSYIIEMLELAEKEETTVETMPPIPEGFAQHVDYILTLIPGLTVMFPEDDWSKLINATLSIIDNYVGVYVTVSNEIKNTDLVMQLLTLQDKLARCAKAIELNGQVENLVPALAALLIKMEHFNSVQPFTFQLSKEYLDALNFSAQDNDIQFIL